MASSRDIVKKAGRAATEAALQAAQPDLQERLERIENDLDGRFTQLEEKLDLRFNQLLDAVNQLHERIMRVEMKVEAYVDLTKQQLGSNQQLVEGIVRLEMTQGHKRKRAS